MPKISATLTSRQKLMRKVFPWAFIAFLLLFAIAVTVVFSFSLLAALIALAALLGWAVYSIVRRSLRKRQPIFDGRPLLRYAVCAVLIAVGSFLFLDAVNAIRDGTISFSISGRFTTGSARFIFQRAAQPVQFWETFCAFCYMAVIMYCLAITELIIMRKQSCHHEGV